MELGGRDPAKFSAYIFVKDDDNLRSNLLISIAAYAFHIFSSLGLSLIIGITITSDSGLSDSLGWALPFFFSFPFRLGGGGTFWCCFGRVSTASGLPVGPQCLELVLYIPFMA